MARRSRSTRAAVASEPLPADDMASLGTVSITGPSSFVTGEAQSFTASITSKLETTLLTWEGVGCDLYDAATGGLTGDQDHDETISLTFTTPGEYTIIATYTDWNAENSPSKSEGYVLTVSAPVEPGEPLTMKTESVLEGEPFIGKTLTLIPGTAQGGEEPYNTTYSWESGTDGSWSPIDGFAGLTYVLKETDKGKTVRAVATVTDAKGAELRLATLGTGIVDKEPDQIVEGGDLSGNAQYQAASLLYWFRREFGRDLLITPIDGNSFKMAPNGKVGAQSRMDKAPTSGELELWARWTAWRWAGDMTDSTESDSTITLKCVGGGNFHPCGGQSPRLLTKV